MNYEFTDFNNTDNTNEYIEYTTITQRVVLSRSVPWLLLALVWSGQISATETVHREGGGWREILYVATKAWACAPTHLVCTMYS